MEIIKVEERLMPIYKVSDEFKEHKHESCDYWHPIMRAHPVSNNKSIVIRTKKVVKDGIKSREILGIENVLEKQDLPSDYLNNEYNYIHGGNSYDRIVFNSNTFMYYDKYNNQIYKGMIIPEDEFKYILKYVKRAGERLVEINKRIAKDRKEWNGEEMFTI